MRRQATNYWVMGLGMTLGLAVGAPVVLAQHVSARPFALQQLMDRSAPALQRVVPIPEEEDAESVGPELFRRISANRPRARG